MAKKKAADSAQDRVRALIEENPTWSDSAIHGALKAEGSETSREEVTDLRAAINAKEG